MLTMRLAPQGSFLATCGANRIVNIFNRQGEAKAEIPLDGQGRCLQMGWDQDGEMLAVLQEGSTNIKLWVNRRRTPTALRGAPVPRGSPTLACAAPTRRMPTRTRRPISTRA